MRVRLTPHPRTPAFGIDQIVVELRRARDRLRLAYQVEGAAASISWPGPQEPVRTDGLWRETCFEAFVGAPDGYREYNASPSGQWASYRFSDYRQGMSEAAEVVDVISQARTARRVEFVADVELPPTPGLVGVSVVLKTAHGEVSYWALAHPAVKPDFHHPQSFALALPAPEVS